MLFTCFCTRCSSLTCAHTLLGSRKCVYINRKGKKDLKNNIAASWIKELIYCWRISARITLIGYNFSLRLKVAIVKRTRSYICRYHNFFMTHFEKVMFPHMLGCVPIRIDSFRARRGRLLRLRTSVEEFWSGVSYVCNFSVMNNAINKCEAPFSSLKIMFLRNWAQHMNLFSLVVRKIENQGYNLYPFSIDAIYQYPNNIIRHEYVWKEWFNKSFKP